MARTRSRVARRRESVGRAQQQERNVTVSGDPVSTLVGVDPSRVESDPDTFFGEVFKGATFTKLNVPDRVAAGDDIRVTGVVKFDAPSVVITTRGMRVRASGPGLQTDISERYTNIQHGNTRAFSITIPTPSDAGSTVAFSMNGESTTLTGDWRTDETTGPFRVDVVTQGEAAASTALGYGPWIAAGAGAGYLVDAFRGGPRNLRLIAAGGGLGAAGKTLLPRLSTFDFQFPTTEVAVLGGTAAALAVLLNSTGASGVLGATGDVAGSAISTAGDAVRSRAQR